MSRQIFPFNFGDEPNPSDLDLRPQRVIEGEIPKGSSAPESVQSSPDVTTDPEREQSGQPSSADSPSIPPASESASAPSASPANSGANADAAKALTPIPIPAPTKNAPRK